MPELNPFLDYMVQIKPEQRPMDYVFFWKVNWNLGELSQWYPCDFVCDDLIFSTCEQYMMYKKAEIFNDTGIMDMIINSPRAHPSAHKRMGRSVANFNPDVWANRDMGVVINANFCKFTQNEHLLEVLMSTGSKQIVEASPTDRIWGIGFDEDNALANRKMWGSNKLGRCLMMVRQMIWDMHALMANSTNGTFGVNITTIIVCYTCISTTIVSAPTPVPNQSRFKLMVSTCSDCARRRGLAVGVVDDSDLTVILEILSRGMKTTLHRGMLSDTGLITVIHPSVLNLMDTRSCTVTKLLGFKDSAGNMIRNWREA